VANNAPDQRTVSVIDTVNLRKVKDIETGSRPKPVISPNGRLLRVHRPCTHRRTSRKLYQNGELVKVINSRAYTG